MSTPHHPPRAGRPPRRAAGACTPRPSRPARSRARALAVVVGPLLVLAACSGDDGADGGATTTTVAAPAIPAEDATTPTITVPEGFVAPDTRGVALRPVVGKDQPEPDPEANLLPLDGGEAELRVTVVGPEGRVGGAAVRFERFEGTVRGWVDTRTNKEGLAVLTGAPGGRYRIRAWDAPVLASTESQTVFLARAEEVDLQVRVEPHESPVLQGALTVPVWQVGDTARFDALLVKESVDGLGIIQGEPLPGDVTLTPIAGARVDTANPAPTDPANGRTAFGVVCLVPGIHQAVLTTDGLSTTVELPECRAAAVAPPPSPDPAQPLPTPPPPGVALPPGAVASEPSVVAVEVGGSFAPPFAGPVPAGTYVAESSPGACSTSYEVLAGDRWVPQQSAGGTLVLGSPARSFAAGAGTSPCTFRRTA